MFTAFFLSNSNAILYGLVAEVIENVLNKKLLKHTILQFKL